MKHYSREEIRAMLAELPEALQPTTKRHGKPFSKGNDGRARRNARRAAIARKRAFIG